MAPETPKGVSSRLLTMKFMQRAAASASSAGSPDSESHSAKKRKLGHASPSEERINLNINQAAIKAALDDQESRRRSALEKHTGGGDTHWVLNSSVTSSKATTNAKTPLNVVYVGYGDIDSSNESGDNEEAPANGRTSTRVKSSKAKKPASQNEQEESGDSSDDDSDASDESEPRRKRKQTSDSPHNQSARSRSRSRSQPRLRKEDVKAKEFRDKRKKKEVKLSKLTSISSGGGSNFSTNGKAMTCYNCHQTGHKASDCPSASGGRKR